jgi:translation elongation factor EF-Ts
VSVVEVNSETDFVGRSEPFQQLIKAAAAAAAAILPQLPAAVQVQQLDVEKVSEPSLFWFGLKFEPAQESQGAAASTGQVL